MKLTLGSGLELFRLLLLLPLPRLEEPAQHLHPGLPLRRRGGRAHRRRRAHLLLVPPRAVRLLP